MTHNSTTPARAIRYKQPIEVVADALPTSVGRVAIVIAVAALIALMLGSEAILNWANNLPIGPTSDFILYAAQAWHDFMTRLGVTDYAEEIRKFLRTFEAWR